MSDVKEKLLAGATVIDVRTVDEYKDDHFPGAKNIPVDVLPSRMGEVGPKDRPVIVYCASGGRSAIARAMLKANGFVDVTDAGGFANMPA
jgi:phage shock protein E